jgi:hypothetical protein
MKHLRKFNEEFTDDHKENLSDRNRRYNELKSIKIKLYESQNPPMVEVFQDLNDYLLELTDKYGEVESKYGDVRPVIDFDDLDLVVDVGKDNDYLIASEKNYIWQGFNRVEMDPTQIETSKKLSMYGTDFDWDFLYLYKKNNGKVNTFYSILIGFDSDYLGGREVGWPQEQIKEMTDELRNVVSSALKRLSAKAVKIEQYNQNKVGSWEKVPNLESISYPRISVGFKI